MYFFIKDDKVWHKCNKIWDVVENKLNIKLHSEPVCEYKYLKAKLQELNGIINTFWKIVCQKEICVTLALLA